MLIKQNTKRLGQDGVTLIEVLVAIALTGIILPTLAVALITSSIARPMVTQQLVAQGYLSEMTEALRSIRENGWSNVSTDGTYHTVAGSTGWSLAGGSTTSGNFTQQLTINDVERNSSGAIVSSGGTVDPSTKLVSATVSWTEPANSSLTANIYLTRWQNETDWKQDTQAVFSGDTLTNTTATAGGIQLSSGQTSGTAESTTFDAGSDVSFNYFEFADSLPSGTNIKFQVAANNDNATWNFVGPDGTSSTYYTSNGPIPLNMAGNRYFRWEATLSSTSGSITPTLSSAEVTYSP